MTSLADHLEGVRVAVVALGRSVGRSGLEAPVPTTPDWTVRRLVAHQGMVHRWASATVLGEAARPDAWEEEGLRAADPVDWLQEGAIGLVTALSAAPADLDAPVFLADAPAPREFWARRQCHETTVHAVDALSAELGRHPVAADATWITTDLALDAIDELLTGFLPRPVSRLRCDDRRRIVVRPDEGRRAWLVEVSAEPPVTTRLARADDVAADVELTGSAVALELTLWNRSNEVSPSGWDLWRDSAQVRWSR